MGIKEIKSNSQKIIQEGVTAKKELDDSLRGIEAAKLELQQANQAFDLACQVDENGNYRGDVAAAKARLNGARSSLQLANSRYEAAKAEIKSINERKKKEISIIDEYNKGELLNKQKFEEILKMSYGSSMETYLKELVARMNEVEKAKADLQKSMGMNVDVFSYSAGSGSPGGIGGGGASSSTEVYNDTSVSSQDHSSHSRSDSGLNFDDLDIETLKSLRSALLSAYVYGQDQDIPDDIKVDYLMSESDFKAANGRARTPNEILRGIKVSIRENWMNNFNPELQKKNSSEAAYRENLRIFRYGLSLEVGSDIAEGLTDEQIEFIASERNIAYLSGKRFDTLSQINELKRATKDWQSTRAAGFNDTYRDDIEEILNYADAAFSTDSSEWQESACRYLDYLDFESSVMNKKISFARAASDRAAAAAESYKNKSGSASEDNVYNQLYQEKMRKESALNEIKKEKAAIERKKAEISSNINPEKATYFRGFGGKSFVDVYDGMLTNQQGQVNPNCEGDCGITSSCSAYNQQTGSCLGEADGIDIFVREGLCITGSDPKRNGGTSMNDRIQFFKRMAKNGESFEFEKYSAGISRFTPVDIDVLAKKFFSGSSILMSVYGDDIWDEDVYKRKPAKDPSPKGKLSRFKKSKLSDHCVCVAGFSCNRKNEVVGMWINDTGGSANRLFISRDKFEQMQRTTRDFSFLCVKKV